MSDKPAMLVINTGGTLNKRYDPLTGNLYVPREDTAVQALIAPFVDNLEVTVLGAIYKDSLEMDDQDRAEIAKIIRQRPGQPVLVVHGTDTMAETAAVLAKECPDRRIVLTGAMEPVAFGGMEAMSNFALSVGFLLADDKPGVFIGMHGLVRPHERISKDRKRGVFVPL